MKSKTKLSTHALQSLHDELSQSILAIADRHGVDVSILPLKVSDARQIIHLGARLTSKAYNEKRQADPYLRLPRETSAQMRFRKHHHRFTPTLKPEHLGQCFQIGRKKMTLLGLYGRQHKALLWHEKTQTTVKMPMSEFLTLLPLTS